MGTDHIRKDVAVASGAGRIVCSCGWRSSVRDDGYMYEPLSIPSLGQGRGAVMRNPDIEAEWHRHIVNLRAHAG
jgi:hypothetical protein